MSAAHFRAMGAACANLHAKSATFNPPPEFDRPHWDEPSSISKISAQGISFTTLPQRCLGYPVSPPLQPQRTKNMRKTVSHLILTLDGVTVFDAAVGTIVKLRDKEVLEDFFAHVAEEDAMLLGRVTYGSPLISTACRSM